MNIYCISGFGADQRIFKYLDFNGNSPVAIRWIKPLPGEPISGYAKRLVKDISDSDPVLIGVSFGGMMAIEISKIIPVKKVILISSIKNQHEKPLYFRLASGFYLDKIIPLKPYKFLESFENRNLSVKTEEQRKLAAEYRENIDMDYSKWAIHTILNWKNEYIPPNMIHIHGSADHIFPLRYVHPDFIIPGGGHLMIMNEAPEINTILNSEI